MPRKKIQKKPEIKPAEPSKSNLVLKSDVSKIGDQEVSAAPMRVQEQLLDDETRALQVIYGWYTNYALVKNLAILHPETLLRWSWQVFLTLSKKRRQRWWKCQHLIILCQRMFYNKLNRSNIYMTRLLKLRITWSAGTRNYPRRFSGTAAVEPFSSSFSLFSLSPFFFLTGITTELVHEDIVIVLFIPNDQITKTTCLSKSLNVTF